MKRIFHRHYSHYCYLETLFTAIADEVANEYGKGYKWYEATVQIETSLKSINIFHVFRVVR